MFKKSPRICTSVQGRSLSQHNVQEATVIKKSSKGSVQEESQSQCSRRVQEPVFKNNPSGSVQERSLRNCSRKVPDLDATQVFKTGHRGSIQEKSQGQHSVEERSQMQC